MKIAFDGQLFLGGNKTGIAWNAHNLVLELAKYPENECTIQCFSLRRSKEKLQQLKVYEKAGCRIECCRWFHYSLYKMIWILFPIPYRIFFRSKADITHFFNFITPPGVNSRCVAVIHDMAYKSCPQTVSRKTLNWLKMSLERSCKYADHFITVSEFSKMEIMKYLNIRKEKITVVPNAVDSSFYHPDYTQQQIKKVRKKLKLDERYFLYLGTIEPRKNIERLIGAYARLCKKVKNAPQLVLAGGRGWLCEGIYKKAEELGLGNKVLFTGYIEQEDSPILMCGATAFVFPSLYEGFGMPPLEAMACGTPVIASNTTSLPEVVGNAGILVDPLSEVELCQAMKTLLEDEKYRNRLRVLGLERAKEYTWENSGRILMGVYRELMGDRKK